MRIRHHNQYLLVPALCLSALALLLAPGRIAAQIPETPDSVPGINVPASAPPETGSVTPTSDPTPNVRTHIPVKEVTVFKDGYALVLHEGAMPVDDRGNVIVEDLPAPVLGTFWSYSADLDGQAGFRRRRARHRRRRAACGKSA